MATIVDTLIVKVEGDLDNLDKSFKKSSKVVQTNSKKMSSSANAAAKSFGGLGKSALKLAGIIGAVGLAFKSVKNIFAEFSAVDALAKTSDRLGITTEALVGLQFAAAQTGVEGNVLATSLQRLNRRLSEVATTGGGTAKKSLDALGLTAEELLVLPLEKQFGLIGDRLQTVSSQADRTAIAFGFFDTEGGKLLNTLRVGTDGLEAFKNKAQELGIAISRVDAAKIEAANDTLDRLSSTFIGASRTAAVALAPAIDFVASQLAEMNATGSESSPIFDKIAKSIVVGFRLAQLTIAGAQVVINAVIVGFSKLGSVATKAAILVIKGFRRLQAGISGIGIVAVSIADAFVRAFQSMGQTAGEVWDFIEAGADVVGSTMVLVFETAASAIRPVVNGIKRAFAEALDVAAVAAAAAAGFAGADSTLAEGLANKAQALNLSVIRSGRASTDAIDAARSGLDQSVEAFKAAGSALLTGNEPPGSEALQAVAKGLEELAIEQLKAAEGGDALTRSLEENIETIDALTARSEAALDKSIDEGGKIGGVNDALEKFQLQKDAREAAFAEEIAGRENHNQVLADIEARAAANKRARDEEEGKKSIDLARANNEAIARLEQQTNQRRLAAGQQFLSDLSTLQGSENRKAFELGKAAAIAQAGISAILGAQHAFTSLASIPFVGPALGTAAAAAALAAGAINIQKIKATQFGGGGSSVGSAAGGGGAGASGGGGSSQGGGGQGGEQVPQNNFNIRIQGERISIEQAREMIEAINEASADNFTLQVGG